MDKKEKLKEYNRQYYLKNKERIQNRYRIKYEINLFNKLLHVFFDEEEKRIKNSLLTLNFDEEEKRFLNSSLTLNFEDFN